MTFPLKRLLPFFSQPATSSSSSDPGICAECAKKSSTCCHVAPENAELCFPLSKPEAERLRKCPETALPLDEAPNSEEFLTIMYSLFPGESDTVNRLFSKGEKHAILGTDAQGFCVYLGTQGCTLPREIRPWFCRLFPFWVSRGELTAFSAPYCLVCRNTLSVRGMLRKIGQTDPQAKEIYNCLRSDWGFSPRPPGARSDE